MKTCLSIAIIVFLNFFGTAQTKPTIGLILSGCGAKGMAHVGVLKALEEKGIKVDYIVGTSAGALVGGMYAAGYSPEEIEVMVNSDDFLAISNGDLAADQISYFYRESPSPSYLNLRFNVDSVMLRNISSSTINTTPLDFHLFNKLTKANMAAQSNFDSLLIPFRCVASSVERKTKVVFSEGNLHNAIRASMSFPMYLNPIEIGGELCVDGGLYDNFPADVMLKEFNPDIVIGVDVSSSTDKLNEENALDLIEALATDDQSIKLDGPRQITIYPNTGIGTFDFKYASRAIDSGYLSTVLAVDTLSFMPEMDCETRILERKTFRTKFKNPVIAEVEVVGVSENKANYIRKALLGNRRQKVLTVDRFEDKFFTIVNSEFIKSARIEYEVLVSGELKLKIHVVQAKSFKANLGAFLSTRPVNMAYLGVGYQLLAKVPFTFDVNGYYGKYYGSVNAELETFWPVWAGWSTRARFTMNRNDYYESFSTFFEESKPSFIITSDIHLNLRNSFYLYNKSKVNVNFGYGRVKNRYYEGAYITADTMTNTTFWAVKTGFNYDHNSLNRDQFATEGVRLNLGFSYWYGKDDTSPGSTSLLPEFISREVQNITFQLKYEHYLYGSKYFSLGIYAEGAYAIKDFHTTYYQSKLMAPRFSPIPDASTLFIPEYMNDRFIGAGMIAVGSFKRLVDLRLEAYYYQAIQTILANDSGGAYYGDYFSSWGVMASASVIYHSIVGPLRFSTDYIHGIENPFIFQLSLGLLLSNEKFENVLPVY